MKETVVKISRNSANGIKMWFKVTAWEANGYDDSDGDTLYYNPDAQKIEHDFWTTRGYCKSSIPFDVKAGYSYQDGIEAGIFTAEDVRKALLTDTGDIQLSLNNLYRKERELNVPVHSTARQGFRGDGYLLRVEEHCYRDYWGRQCSKTYGICYQPKTNTIYKTLTYNLQLADINDKLNEIWKERVTIDQLCSYVSSKNSCSKYKNDWVADLIAKVCMPYMELEIPDDAIDKTDVSKKPSVGSKRYQYAKEKVELKTKQFRTWVNTLEDKTDEEREEIFNRTMRKYCSKEMQIIADAEAKMK